MPHKTINPHYVYLMQDGAGGVKIGHSNNPDKRLGSIRNGSSTRVELVKAWEMSRDAALNMETEAHALLSYARVSGEWFKVSTTYAEAVLNALASPTGDAFSLALALRAMEDINELHDRLAARLKVTNTKGREAVDALREQIRMLRNAEKCVMTVAADFGLNDFWTMYAVGCKPADECV